MEKSFCYLKEIREALKTQSPKEVIYILGNTSVDIDSVFTSYLLSIGKNIQNGSIVINDSKKPSISKEITKLYFPVINCHREEIKFRQQITFLFEKFGIDRENFFYFSDDIFNPQNLKESSTKTKINFILVDHNALDYEQKYLSPYVTEIYDHHLLTSNDFEFPNLLYMNIKHPIASCSTLILLDYFLKDFPECIVPPLLAITPILVDTKNFRKEYYKIRWVDLDSIVYEKIKSLVKGEKPNMKEYFKEIKGIKKNLDNLNFGAKNLLSLDQKKFSWNDKKVWWTTLSFPFKLLKEKFGEDEVINQFKAYYENKSKEEVDKSFFVTGSRLDETKKLYTIFNPVDISINDDVFKNELQNKLKENFLSFSKDKVQNSVLISINVKKDCSRKIMEPLLNDIFTRYLKTCK